MKNLKKMMRGFLFIISPELISKMSEMQQYVTALIILPILPLVLIAKALNTVINYIITGYIWFSVLVVCKIKNDFFDVPDTKEEKEF